MGVGRGTRQVFLGHRQSELGFLDWPLPSQPRRSAKRPPKVGAARRAAPRFRRKAPSLRDKGGCAAKVGRLGDPSLPGIFRQALTHQPRKSANRSPKVGAARRAAPRFRREAPSLRDKGGCAAKVGRLGDPSLPGIFSIGADAPTASSQPSSFWILFQPGFSRVLLHECRPQVLAARSSALGGYSRSRVFYDLLRQGSEFDAFRLARNRSRNQRLDPASRELADLVGPCGHHHAGSCALGSWISARSKCGQKHLRLETMDGSCTSIRLAAGFFRAPATRRGKFPRENPVCSRKSGSCGIDRRLEGLAMDDFAGRVRGRRGRLRRKSRTARRSIPTLDFSTGADAPTARKRESFPKGRGGSPSGPKIQAQSAVSARQGRLRRKSRTARRSIPTWDFR